MNPMKLFWGLVIAGIGILLLGANLGYWNVDLLQIFWYLWPLILIVLGLRFLIDNDNIFIILTIAIVVFAGYVLVERPASILGRFEEKTSLISESLSTNYDKEKTRKLNLKLDLGASKVTIGSLSNQDSEDKLYKVDTKNYGKIETIKKDDGDVANIEMDEKFAKDILNSRVGKREFTAMLNDKLPVDLEVNSGASALDYDFTDVKLGSLKINAGASSSKIKFGKLQDLIQAKVDMGASTLGFSVPKGTGLKVVLTSDGLNNKNFANELELSKTDDDTYVSKNYESSEKKIFLTIKAGVSNITINQY